jgi:hypothetical protein
MSTTLAIFYLDAVETNVYVTRLSGMGMRLTLTTAYRPICQSNTISVAILLSIRKQTVTAN